MGRTLLGRAEESERLRALLAGVRNEAGGALLVIGEPGIGKTSLVESAVHDQTQTLRVLAIQGVEVESGIAYGALQRLGGPLIAFVDDIPDTQRAALRIAAGLDEGPPPQPPLVGLGFLSLLARAGADRPTLCVVDDAHHVDAESLLVLGFVARRLSAERVGVVVAARADEGAEGALAGVPRIELGGLGTEAGSALLRRGVDGELDPTVAAEYVRYTAGNPLALRELATELSAAQLTATAIAHSPIPIGGRLETIYTQRMAELPAPSRDWLLVAAAESSGDPAAVQAAADALGIPPDASAPAEAIDLVSVRNTVRFRHPLIRSAVYGAATDAARRRVHRALADGARRREQLDVAAHHAAAAVHGTDAEVAAELAAAADTAGARGGMLSRAHLLARAAELTPDASEASDRSVAAAEAALSAGAARLAMQLLPGSDVDLTSVGRARKLIVEAMAGLFLSDPEGLRTGMAKLMSAADLVGDVAPGLRRQALLLALNSATVTEEQALGATVQELGARMREASQGDDIAAVVLQAASAFILDDYATAAPVLRRATEALRAESGAGLTSLAFFVTVPCVALWDWDAAAELLRRSADIGRTTGALRDVDACMWILSAVELSRVNPKAALDYVEQSAELRRALGFGDEQAVNAALLAWQGTPSTVVEQITHAIHEAGWGGISRMAVGAIAINEIAAGSYESAFERLTPLVRHPFLQASFHHLPEYVEAAVRSGNRAAAQWALDRIQVCADASGSTVARALFMRSLALLSDDADAERHFVQAIALFPMSHRGDTGRTRLVYGEWLRRVRRRTDARGQLAHALRDFEAVGATTFAERARREILAAGGTVPSGSTPVDPLSSQERQVALLAARGATNAEIAATMFISPNTVDYHLRKVFRKLEISSRRQLADRFTRD
ncbi:LuxR C-terminal-related transcriptional regulator [Microbacterium sp. ET2]|uniref:AAA family ATPase n=1 Tax=Microbacterium albipurpureum TaxID=3050384 RepID=UPI00259CCD9D|nr:LuxR family transcriptional regulator [Microbacterium sp. ET2 (Ac-2212)]WJL94936.1 LuxR C-terminal-related transcriptional regulator [Microbacterium sp. ET2 (Ac-2212)]